MRVIPPMPPFTTTEIVYTWGDGREEVRYRRTYGSAGAAALMEQVKDLQSKQGPSCPYSIRHI